MLELLTIVDKLVEEVLSQLALLGEKTDIAVRFVVFSRCFASLIFIADQSRKQQGTLALDLVNLLVGSVQMNPTSATLVVKVA